MANDDNVFDLSKFKKEQQSQKQPQQKQLTQQDVMEAPDVQCVRCGGELFLPANRLKRISKLLTGAQQDQIYPMQTLVCANCGWEFGRKMQEQEETPSTAFDDSSDEEE